MNSVGRRRAGLVAALVAPIVLSSCGATAPEDDDDSSGGAAAEPDRPEITLPPQNGDADYQIGGDYNLRADTAIVSRDWYAGEPAQGSYSICYVNAFQTQPDDPDVERSDETSAWPAELVLTDLADDPNWTGEYLIDLSTAPRRDEAAERVSDMVATCADKGFDAVEFDNLDSWDRFEDLPSVQALVSFDRADTIKYATAITADAHERGLAVGQKNTLDLAEDNTSAEIGFDFAIVEQCGEFEECGAYAKAYDDHVVDIEYTEEGFEAACADFGSRLSIVRRDLDVLTPADEGYLFDQC